MKLLIHKILLESQDDKVINTLNKKGFERWNYIGIHKLLNSYGYDSSEIKDIFKKYFTGGKNLDDVEMVEELVRTLYGPLDYYYDEDNDEWNFEDKDDNLIFNVSTYNDAGIPYAMYDIMNYLDIEDFVETMKKYFQLNFGIVVRDVDTSVSLG